MRGHGMRRISQGGNRAGGAVGVARRYGPLLLLAVAGLTLLVVQPDTILGKNRQLAEGTVAANEYPKIAQFASTALVDTTKTWTAVLAEREERYEPPTSTMFAETVSSTCTGDAVAEGPFYCVQNRRIYVDLAFLDTLANRVDGQAGLAQAYVVAHLVGHHVQNLLGATDKVRERQDGMTPPEAEALTVRLELQADCLAGVWASRTTWMRGVVSSANVEQGLNAVAELGAEIAESKSENGAVPDSFTHASAEQRARWFRRGAQDGDIDKCDTLAGKL